MCVDRLPMAPPDSPTVLLRSPQSSPQFSPSSSSNYRSVSSDDSPFLITSPESCDSRGDESSDTEPKGIGSPKGGQLQKSVNIETCIRLNYTYLKDELQPEEIADMFYGDGLFDDENIIERISEAKERRFKCDILLKAISKKGKHLPRKRLFDILKRTGFEYTILRLQTKTFQDGCKCKIQSNILLQFINEMKKDLFEEIEPLQFIDDILVRGGLSFVDHEDIMNMTHRHDRVKSVLDKAEKSSGETTHSIVCPITTKYKEMFDVFLSRKGESTNYKEQVCPKGLRSTSTEVKNFKKTSVGARLNVKFRFETTHGESEERLKSLEKNIVRNGNRKQSLRAKLHNTVMEDCISSLEQIKFSSVILQIKTMSRHSSKKLIQACGKGQIAKWILDLLTDEDINTLKRLQVNVLAVEISSIRQNEEAGINCSCNLTKEFITRYFTVLENEMRGSRAIVKRFVQSGLLSKEDVQELNQVTRDSNIKKRNTTLLKYVLTSKCPPVLRCIMESEILQHCTPTDRVMTLLRADTPVKSPQSSLIPRDIKKHRKFLEEELDGRTFIREIAIRNKQIEDKLLVLKTRKERTNIFLEFLCNQSGDLKWFEDALKLKKMDYILDKIYLAKESKYRNDLSPITSNYQLLLTEIEPRRLAEFFEGTSIMSKAELQLIVELPSRKERAARMLQVILTNKDHRSVDTFLRALEYASYNKLAELIRTGFSYDFAYCCPLIVLLDSNSSESDSKLIYKGTIQIDLSTCACSKVEDKSCVEKVSKCKSLTVTSCDQCEVSSDDSMSDISTIGWLKQEGTSSNRSNNTTKSF